MARNRVNGGRTRPATPAAGGEWDGGGWRDWVDPRRVGWLRLLLFFIPAAIVLELAGASAPWRFLISGLAIVPLAGLMGEATEQLARRLGPGIGGLLNATFGNAAELIIALFGLFKGLDGVVKASLTGSILGNLLLVLGASLLAGGVKYPILRFNRTAVGAGASLMALAAIGMIVPAAFHWMAGPEAEGLEHRLSVAVSVLLLLAYGLNLLFSLVTHQDLYNPQSEGGVEDDDETWGTRRATIILLTSTAFVALMSEFLVGAVDDASKALGLTEVFVGVIVVAVVGNAAEHSTAVLMALKNKMDLAVGIAFGSALQIALFVAPVLVLVSYLRPEPMDLLFTTMEVAAVFLAVFVARMVTEDGESNWLEGAMLLLLYAILTVTFFFLPHVHEPRAGERPGPSAAADGP